MDERRDLVDREELRRQMEGISGPIHSPKWRTAISYALVVLDAMPSVECPRGWTRDEVLAELDAAEQRGDKAVCERQHPCTTRWNEVARWSVEGWHPEVRRYDVRVEVVERAPEWVPLTQLVGRTIDGCDEAVRWRTVSGDGRDMWSPDTRDNWHEFPEGALNGETGLVAVRPKADG